MPASVGVTAKFTRSGGKRLIPHFRSLKSSRKTLFPLSLPSLFEQFHWPRVWRERTGSECTRVRSCKLCCQPEDFFMWKGKLQYAARVFIIKPNYAQTWPLRITTHFNTSYTSEEAWLSGSRSIFSDYSRPQFARARHRNFFFFFKSDERFVPPVSPRLKAHLTPDPN